LARNGPAQHRDELDALVERVGRMQQHVVFCVKPNLSMMPHFDAEVRSLYDSTFSRTV
jgi:hypothetical protein